ncbi:MAG: hypothetical protein JNK66_13375 [Chitinophagales bacterium]|nr:hypothetical protein [Chitinophagales bacterium]
MKKNHLLPFLVILLSAYSTFAQQGLALQLENYTVQNQQGNVNFGYTITINSTLTNTDSANWFAGTVDFGLRNSSVVLTQANIFGKPTYSGDSIILQPGESVPAVFSVEVSPQYFGPGPDVVVVWPICTSPVNDSVVIPLLVNNPSAIEEQQAIKQSFYVDKNEFILLNHSAEQVIKQVRFYHINGQQLSVISNPINHRFSIAELPAGVLVAEIVTNMELLRIKFIH